MNSYGPLHPSRIDKGVAASVAATRQKSCNACVRGKRRCDKRAPKCTRCSTKGLDCVYARIPPGASASDVLLNDDDACYSGSAAASVSADMPDFGAMGFMDMPSLAGSSAGNTSPESSLDLGGDASDASGLGHHGLHGGGAEFETMQMDGDMGFSIADLLASGTPAMGELWDISSFGLDTVPVPGAGAAKLDPPPLEVMPPQPVRDLTMFREKCVSVIDPLEVHDARSRPGHFLKVFSELHTVFSQTRALPFIHPRLYATQPPKTIMSAFCAASAYTNRTPETRGWTVRLLMDTTKEIYAEGEGAATPLEKVARVHALLVLNTMRMLDGDIGLRSAAEKELPVMLGWVRDLVDVRDGMEEGVLKSNLVAREHPPKSWESWLLLENVRRAIIASVSFICLISLLKGENIESDLWVSPLHFVSSRHLWAAQSSLEFYRAWQDKPKFFIEQMQYKEFWQYATPDDLDEFTRIMLTTQMGTEAVDHFMSGAATSVAG